MLSAPQLMGDDQELGVVAALGYPQRVAKRRIPLPRNVVKHFLAAITAKEPVTSDPLTGLLVMVFGGLINFVGRHEPPHGVLGAVAGLLYFQNVAVYCVHECP